LPERVTDSTLLTCKPASLLKSRELLLTNA
jgi:hypothetical protein